MPDAVTSRIEGTTGSEGSNSDLEGGDVGRGEAR